MPLAVHTDNRKQNDGAPDWRAVKELVAILVALLLIVFMMLDMAMINFRAASGIHHLECNRWGQI